MRAKGIVVVNTGDGKGKTTAALGMVLRAVGHGMRVLVMQFVKSDENTGELRALDNLESVTVKVMGAGFLNDPAVPLEKHKEAAKKALAYSWDAASSGDYGMIVLDEILFAVKEDLLTEEDVAGLISSRPDSVHLVMTGRGCPKSLIEKADIVTDMSDVKHSFADGIPAQPGVEY